MPESSIQNFNHLKIHTQYSICEGAIKIDDLQDFSKSNKIKTLALCDTTNLCGALEFAEKISKVGTQPVIGTQINFKFGDTMGLLPLFSLNEEGYKRIIKLSSLSFLENKKAAARIKKVAQRALIGANLTHGACTKIGKITKKEDHSRNAIGLDKKVLLTISNPLWNLGFKLSFTSNFLVINSSNALRLLKFLN